ncbi:hypothetical protein ABZ208_15735 [Streptomyces sp. NPDC006208]|uniref:hypothetical protein n=1 Tax=Streptomyces sp. NPDC006208 TaxID=3156734 RepID=UPI0033B6EA6C
MAERVEIPEYEQEFELAGSEQLVTGPEFWFLHLYMWQGEPRATAEHFGADTADVDALYERLFDEDAPWPVFRGALRRRARGRRRVPQLPRGQRHRLLRPPSAVGVGSVTWARWTAVTRDPGCPGRS